MYATELAKLGHSVNLFTKVDRACDKDGVIYIPYQEWASEYHSQKWDALCSWMTPEPLKIAPSGAYRFFNQQVSDFGQCEPGWESYVDILAPLSHNHARHLRPMCSLPVHQWRILYNGTDTTQFRPGNKIRGKMIWASSHDRGLHWLLELFPKLKKEVPEAHLNIFYNFHGVRSFSGWTSSGTSQRDKFVEELGRRSRYTLEAIRRLKGKGVTVHESVSRETIRQEMATSQVLAYPLDPVRYTETFGVTVLEACASGTVPVICTADAFGELWSECSSIVDAPYSLHKDEYLSKLIRLMNNDVILNIMSNECVKYAYRFDWKPLVKGLETFLESRGKTGLPEVNW